MTQVAQSASTTKYNQAYSSFVGGQNSASAPDNLNDNEVKLAENFDILSRGAMRVRDGTVNTTWDCLAAAGVSASSQVDRFIEFSKADGTLVQLVLVGGGLYTRGSTTPLLTDIGSHLDYAVHMNKAYILMKNSYYTYDGTTLTEVTNSQSDSMLATVKKCKYIEFRAERVFMAGNPEAPNCLYYSQVGDLTYFKSGSHVLNVPSSDGDQITALQEYNSSMLVFKANGIWEWSGYDPTADVEFNKLNSHTGTMHYRTVQLVNSFLYYLGNDGVYTLRSTYNNALVTQKISVSVDNAFSSVYSNYPACNNTAVAIYYRGKYLLSFPDESKSGYATRNNSTLVAHVDTGDSTNVSWTQYKGVDFASVFKSGDKNIYYGKAGMPNIFIYSETAYSDAGSQIEFSLETKDYDMGSTIHIKKYKRAYIWVNQSKVEHSVFDVNIKVDYIDTPFEDVDTGESLSWDVGKWNTSKWGWINTVTRAFKLSAKGVRVCVQISGASTEATKNRVYIYGMGFTYKVKKLYKD